MECARRFEPFPCELFWDVSADSLSWEKHRGFIVRRVLAEGGEEDVRRLFDLVGRDHATEWPVESEGRGMPPRRLRFWGVVLELPKEQVDRWVARERESIWGRRCR
ncbi:hypothetical protein SAMN02745206_03108 [Desulfacinum infernum DSM 9756]|jgi:hypothetical protein|uniref:DUF6922 domain-containing protein n=1 Tax=Desulfacinum infernum DSM 9756 TaxID=1121391 RepID=A0A1M5GCU4_9BACT|nr:hypothetical protein [Desulfacinum infernum]SHG01534.1 hypothetical protein SAMN02745206_03108 [Desulfacinum infernum DSM 9756]